MNARVPVGVIVDAPIVLDAPYGKFHVGFADDLDHALMRAEQLRDVLALMFEAYKPNVILRTAMPLGAELYDLTRRAIDNHPSDKDLSAALLFAGEAMDFLLKYECDCGPRDVMFWLAQQLCDEVRGTLAGMAEARGTA